MVRTTKTLIGTISALSALAFAQPSSGESWLELENRLRESIFSMTCEEYIEIIHISNREGHHMFHVIAGYIIGAVEGKVKSESQVTTIVAMCNEFPEDSLKEAIEWYIEVDNSG